jgi:hypothetical protein
VSLHFSRGNLKDFDTPAFSGRPQRRILVAMSIAADGHQPIRRDLLLLPRPIRQH